MQALEEEARLAEEKFQEINSKWRIIESFNDPLDINNASQVQRGEYSISYVKTRPVRLWIFQFDYD